MGACPSSVGFCPLISWEIYTACSEKGGTPRVQEVSGLLGFRGPGFVGLTFSVSRRWHTVLHAT